MFHETHLYVIISNLFQIQKKESTKKWATRRRDVSDVRSDAIITLLYVSHAYDEILFVTNLCFLACRYWPSQFLEPFLSSKKYY